MVYPIFCRECDALLLDAPACSRCGWRRPYEQGEIGREMGEPLPLGRSVSGRPAEAAGMLWYAAPPEEPETPGSLMALHREGDVVRRHSLWELMPAPALPVAEGLESDLRHIFAGLRDFALGDRRAPKSLLALEPRTGKPAWEVATASRELSTPLLQGGTVYVAGTSPGAVYAVDVGQQRPRWTGVLEADCRYWPVVADSAVVAVAGSMLGTASLVGLEPDSGLEQWRREAGSGFGQPSTDGQLVFAATDRALLALEAATGDECWQYADVRRTSTGVVTAAPVVAGDLLLLAVGAGERSDAHYALDALACDTGRRRWRFPLPDRSGRIKVAPAVIGDTVIVGGGSGHVYALGLESGRLRWQATLARRLAAPPVAAGDALLLPSRDGFLYRLRRRRASPRPTEPPEAYEARGEWAVAAVAHALADPPDLSAAGRCLLQADEPRKAFSLFEAAGDARGCAEALAAQERYGEAIELLPQGEGVEQRAHWLGLLGRHGEAAEAYVHLQRWEAAAAAYERAQRPLKAIEAYKQAGCQEDVRRLAAEVDLKAVDKLVSLLGWQVAADRYHEAGHLAAAADLLEEHGAWREALDLRLQEGNWRRVRDICKQIGDWEGEAEACMRLADSLPQVQIRVDGQGRASGELPTDLYEQARHTFLDCGEFSSNRGVSTLFADPRLAPWRHRIARRETTAGRVDGLLAYLPRQFDRGGQNGLVLLTQVLADRYEPQDQLHVRLQTLAEKCERALASPEEPLLQEVDSPEAARWRAAAGDIYAGHERWKAAERCYRQAGHVMKWAQSLAQQGRWEEAGDLLSDHKTGFGQAAAYYWRAADAALATVPAWQPRNPAAATLLEKAGRCCLYAGNIEGLFVCRIQADRCLRRPRLVLGEGQLPAPFQQGISSRFNLTVHNVGYGPAADVQLWACGSAMKRTREEAIPVSPVVDVITEGAQQTMAVGLEPRAAGHEGVPLQFELYVRYRDVAQENEVQEDGPHEINEPVLPADAEPVPGQAVALRVHYRGSYMAGETDVDLLRRAKEAIASGQAAQIVLGRRENNE